jgi:hypothetical protein
VCAALKALGGEGVLSESKTYDPKATHTVVVDVVREQKTLGALAAGRWLVYKEWVEQSASAGGWLPEEPFELYGALNAPRDDDACVSFSKDGMSSLWVGAPRAHRQRREQRGPCALSNSLSGHVYVLSRDKRMRPNAERLSNVIKAGGEQRRVPRAALSHVPHSAACRTAALTARAAALAPT